MLETTGARRTDTSNYSSERRAEMNQLTNPVRNIYYALVGGNRAYQSLTKEGRTAVREHAKLLYATGQDFEASVRRFEATADGFVYIITNPAWSALKIGMAVEPHGRLKGYQTSCPNRDYKLEDYVYVTDRRKAEKELHEWLGPRRLEGEWFDVPLGEARMCLGLIKEFYQPEKTNVTVRSSE